MKIGTRLTAAFMALVILLTIIGGSVFVFTKNLNNTKEEITFHVRVLDELNNFSMILTHDYMEMNEYTFGQNNDSEISEILIEIKEIDEKKERVLEYFSEQLPPHNVKYESAMISINALHAQIEETFGGLVERRENGTSNMTTSHEAFDKITYLYHQILSGSNNGDDSIGVDSISLRLIQEINELESVAKEQENFLISLGTGGIILGISLALVLSRYTSRSIIKPIKRLVKGAEDIRDGNLDVKLPEEGNDEISELTSIFNQMAISLKEGRDIKEINEKLKDAISKLEHSNKELQEFAYIASHDLQEPLRMVVSYMQLLERRYKEQLDTEAEEFMDFAIDGAVRMQQLINDLLTYSRIASKDKSFESTSLDSVYETAINNLKVAIEESKVKITHEHLPEVTADSSQMVQLFQNLIGNAIKFKGEINPHIHVSAKRKDKEWLFSVKDNGIGMDEEFSERIFIIFQRLHGKKEYSGTGIGLAVCKKIVERHGGRIWVESAPGKGSTFHFTIPRSLDPGPTEEKKPSETLDIIKMQQIVKIDKPLRNNNPERASGGLS